MAAFVETSALLEAMPSAWTGSESSSSLKADPSSDVGHPRKPGINLEPAFGRNAARSGARPCWDIHMTTPEPSSTCTGPESIGSNVIQLFADEHACR
jgi:hypothetical protein